MPRKLLVIAVLIGAVSPATAASAALTTSNITAPADLTRYVDDLGVANDQPTVTGTSNGTTGDAVDVLCVYFDDNTPGRQTTSAAFNVPVGVDGSFSAQINNDSSSFSPCRLHAVPHGAPPPPDLSPFTGPRVTGEHHQLQTITSGPNTGMAYEATDRFTGAKAVNDYYSIAGCGPCDHALIDYGDATTDPRLGYLLWFAGPYFPGLEDGNARTFAQIDGHKTFFGYDANGAPLSNFTPFPAVSWVSAQQPSGDGSITDTEVPVRCQDDTVISTGQCTSTATVGVSVLRTIKHFEGGSMVRTSDAFTSTDGAAHTLDLDYSTDVKSAQGPAWSFPYAGVADFAMFTAAAPIPGPPSAAAAPVSILVNSKSGSADGSMATPRGSLTLGQGFVGGTFIDPATLKTRFQATVPAGATTTIEQVQTIATTTADARALAARAEDLVTLPSLTVAVPAAVTTATTTTVSGVASDARKVGSVTVNGVAATLATDGSYTATVPLSLGPNAITAIVADGEANTASAATSITRVTAPVAPSDTTPPVFKGLAATRSRVKFSLSEAAAVRLVVARRTPGRRVRGKCVKATKTNRKRRACTLEVAVTTKAISAKDGPNNISFRSLKPGSYVVHLTATDAAGNATPAKRSLTVRKPKKKR